MGIERFRARWIVTLGQNALMLYFIHQIIALTLVRQRLGLVLGSWWYHALANVALVGILVGIGRFWQRLDDARRRGGYGQSRNPLALLERPTGFEPATSSLGSWHSATELRPPDNSYSTCATGDATCPP